MKNGFIMQDFSCSMNTYMPLEIFGMIQFLENWKIYGQMKRQKVLERNLENIFEIGLQNGSGLARNATNNILEQGKAMAGISAGNVRLH